MSDIMRRNFPPAPYPRDRSAEVPERSAADAGSPDQLEEAAAGVPTSQLEQLRRSREIQEEHERHRQRMNELYAGKIAEDAEAARSIRQPQVIAEHNARESVQPAEGVGAQRLAGEREDGPELEPHTASVLTDETLHDHTEPAPDKADEPKPEPAKPAPPKAEAPKPAPPAEAPKPEPPKPEPPKLQA